MATNKSTSEVCPTGSRALDLAWCGGLIDGEGCIAVNRRRVGTGGTNRTVSYTPCLQINMVHLPTLERIRDLLGVGNIHRHSACEHTRKQAWSYSANGRMAVIALSQVRPYLFGKAEEADLVLGFYDLGRAWGGKYSRSVPPELLAAREALCERVRALKSKQWSISDRGGATSEESGVQ